MRTQCSTRFVNIYVICTALVQVGVAAMAGTPESVSALIATSMYVETDFSVAVLRAGGGFSFDFRLAFACSALYCANTHSCHASILLQ